MKSLFTLWGTLFCMQIFAGNFDCITTGITLTITTINTTCQKNNGRISIQATGGIAPYNYQLSGPYPSQTNGIFFGLPAGNYTVTVTDAMGTIASQNINLVNTFIAPTASSINIIKPLACNSTDGGFTVVGSGGAPPYSYSLDNINFQNSSVFSDLSAGQYQFAVKDANGCLSFPNAIINNMVTVPDNCPIHVPATAGTIQCNPMYAFGISFNGITGGTAPFGFSSDGINYQSSPTFTNLAPGYLTFWIKDAKGAITLYSRSMMEDCAYPFAVTAKPKEAKCGAGGAITVAASEGLAPYSYSLDGGSFQNGNQFTSVIPGNHTITVKDADNLSISKLVNIFNNCTVVAIGITNCTCGNNNGILSAQASHGTAPYKYSLDGVIYAPNNIFTDLPAAMYTIYAKDATGTLGSATVTLVNVGGPKIVAVNVTPTNCDNRSGTIYIDATGGTAPLEYSIDGLNFRTNPLFTGIGQGAYTVMVRDGNSCPDRSFANVGIGGVFPVVALGNDVTICEGQTLLLDAGNPGASFTWQDNSTNATYLVNKAGKYSVIINKQGCIAGDTIEVKYKLKPRFSLGTEGKICTGTAMLLDPKISDTGIHYQWQDGSTGPAYAATQPGFYSLTATNNCGATTAAIKLTSGICDVYLPNSFTPNGDTKNDLFRIGYGDNVTAFHLRIYNRYGQLLFETTDKQQGWDGNYKGSKMAADTYIWMAQYKTPVKEGLQTMQGTVLLIR